VIITSEYYFPDNWDGTTIYGNTGRFDFSKWEVLRLLLSTLKYYIQEYSIDGIVLKDIAEIIYGDRCMKFHQRSVIKTYPIKGLL